MEQEYELPTTESPKARNFYFAGLFFFIAASLALTLWAYISLAAAR